jgi:hypothetical protein
MQEEYACSEVMIGWSSCMEERMEALEDVNTR